MNNLIILTIPCLLLTLTSYGQAKQSNLPKADRSINQPISNHSIAENRRSLMEAGTLNYYKNMMMVIRDPQTHREAERQFQPLIDERKELKTAKPTKNKK